MALIRKARAGKFCDFPRFAKQVFEENNGEGISRKDLQERMIRLCEKEYQPIRDYTQIGDAITQMIKVGMLLKAEDGLIFYLNFSRRTDDKYRKAFRKYKKEHRREKKGDKERKSNIKKEGLGLEQLGSEKTRYELDEPSQDILETFENRFLDNPPRVRFEFKEWTSLCPKTGQPDFGKIVFEYVPDKLCVESKSVKLYFFSFRNEGMFMETIVGTISRHLVEILLPKELTVIGDFAPRGGIRIIVTSTYTKEKEGMNGRTTSVEEIVL